MKKVFSWLLIACVGFLMAGCNVKETVKETDKGESTIETSQPAAEEKITLRYFGSEDADTVKVMQPVINDFFMKNNPRITVQMEPTPQDFLTKLRIALAAGNEADVMDVDACPSFYVLNPFEPLDDYIKKFNIDLSKYLPETLKFYNYNGKQYGLPTDINNMGFFYNKKLFDEAGLPYPKNGWTWDDLNNYAQKLTKGEGVDKFYGIILPTDWIGAIEPMLWGNNGKVINDKNEYDKVLNSKETADAFEWYASFVKRGLAPQNASIRSMGGAIEMLKTGKVAMVIDGHWQLQSLLNTQGFDINTIGSAPLPVGPAGIKPAVNFCDGYHLSKNSKHKDEAFQLLAFLSGEEMQGAKVKSGYSLPCIIPLLEEFIKNNTMPLRTPFIESAMNKDGSFTFNKFSIKYSDMGAEIEQNVNNVMEKVVLGKATAQEALDEAVKLIKEAEANRSSK